MPIEENVPATMRDGTVLRSDIYLPTVEIGPFPTLISRTPYNKKRESLLDTYRTLASAGYAVVIQDIRGRYASEGEFHPFFNPDWKDAEDGYDTVEWAAAQPWSNGKVGTFGYSYAAWTQWALAPTMPPHLVAMFTGGMAPRTTDFMVGGVFRPGRQLQWLLGSMAPDTQKFLNEPRGPSTPDEWDHLHANVNREKWLWYLPYKDYPLEAIGAVNTRFRDWLDNINVDRWGFSHNFEKIGLPVYHRTGWYDRLIRTVEMFSGMQNRGATEETRKNQRLIIGPWTHTSDLARKTGEVDFGPEAEVDYFSLIIPWFDYWLKGEQNGVMEVAPVRVFTMGANKWRNEQEWPPHRAIATDYYLHSDGNAASAEGGGMLTLAPPSDEPPDEYTYDPRDPVMSLFSADGHDEPHDLSVLDFRQDVLVYQTEPLTSPVEVTGNPMITLYASSTALDTDFTAKLVDVHPNGFAQSLCYGIVRARFREGLNQQKLMTPGEVFEFSIELLPTSNLFKTGHRIRIDISSSDFPNFDRNHNTGGDDYAEIDLIKARQLIFHDRARASRAALPIITR